MSLVFGLCIVGAAGIAIFSLPLGLFIPTFGMVLFGEGLFLLILGGAMGAGLWYKVYSAAWMRSQKQAIREEMKTYHQERRKYTMEGFYLAAVGIIAIFVGLALSMF
ncbi:MAG: hypothetical protein ACFE89_03610 [Candidatus Hodarchaeota archaeon]